MKSDLTVCVAYIHANEEALLQRSLSIMGGYDWVTHLVVLDTNIDKLKTVEGKLTRAGQNFGSGYARPVAKGGLNQIAARNKSIEMAEACGTDWVLLCDADEFFIPELIELITDVDAQGYDFISLPVRHYCAPDKHIVFPWGCEKRDGKLMQHVCPRIFKRGCGAHFVKCRAMTPLGNHTRHPLLVKKTPSEIYRAWDTVYFIHTRHMFKSMTNDTVRIPREIHPADPSLLPEVVIEAWKRLQQSV